MLADVTHDMADLAFTSASPVSAAHERDADPVQDAVRYHALAYLRYVMGPEAPDGGLQGQFRLIERHPHRRSDTTWAHRPVQEAASIGPRSLLAILTEPDRLVPLPPSSSLRGTGLAQRLKAAGGPQTRLLFPREVLVGHQTETFDTHENRLVLRVVELGLDLVETQLIRKSVSEDFRCELDSMRAELSRLRDAPFLREVGDLTTIPSQSTVLQQRDGYLQFRDHYVRLHNASRLGPPDLWKQLLELRDSASLYELWSFFQVKAALEDLLGAPTAAKLFEVTEDGMQRQLLRAAVQFQGGRFALWYNRSFPGGGESYSVMLRPDVSLSRLSAAGETEWLLLDAKLRFDGAKYSVNQVTDLDDAEEGELVSDAVRSANHDDLHKMHTYRDALQGAVGAFALYPGDSPVHFPAETGGPSHAGVGAIPLRPGVGSEHLARLVSGFVAGASMQP